jgi:hypothetical protein
MLRVLKVLKTGLIIANYANKTKPGHWQQLIKKEAYGPLFL